MPRLLCNGCNCFFSPRANVCPNCKKANYSVLIPTDKFYAQGCLTCFACKFSVKRKTAFVKHFNGDGKLWDFHFKQGQIYCWQGQKGKWVHKRNFGCLDGYLPLRILRTRVVGESKKRFSEA